MVLFPPTIPRGQHVAGSSNFTLKHRVRLSSVLTSSLISLRTWGSSVSTGSDYRLDDRGSIPGRGKGVFRLASVSRSALRLTQPPIHWVPGVKRNRSVSLTIVPRSRMSRSYMACPPCRLHGGFLCNWSLFTGVLSQLRR
jgi:hypothetical protein